MTSDDIKKGHYYRAANTVWYVLHIWEPGSNLAKSPARSCEAIRVKDPTRPAESQVIECSKLASAVKCEVVPKFSDVVVVEPDPRQTDVEDKVAADFIGGLLDG